MAVIGGVKRIQVDDLAFEKILGDSCTVTANTITRESVTGMGGVAGARENHRPGRIEFSLNVDSTVNLKTLAGKEDATVTVITKQKVYTLCNCWQVGDIELSAADGTTTVAFEGPELKSF